MSSLSVAPCQLPGRETRHKRIHAPRCRLFPCLIHHYKAQRTRANAVRLRPAEHGDAKDIAALEAGQGGWTFQQVQDEIAREVSHTVVAVDNNCIVGWVTIWCIPPFESQIIQITVCPGRQRQGIATQLLKHMIKASATLGVSTVVLEVREDNIAARRLYEKLGFKDVGIRKNYYKDGSHAVLMERT